MVLSQLSRVSNLADLSSISLTQPSNHSNYSSLYRYERSYPHVLQLHMLRDLEHAFYLDSDTEVPALDVVHARMLNDHVEWSTRLAITPAKVGIQ